mmetsp:Transcript_15118/g.16811  ORF Transcript_15118/g.16811 Transcript_15118/m.16811 type:complete len:98 (-) Transcript_15118:149-442(-)
MSSGSIRNIAFRVPVKNNRLDAAFQTAIRETRSSKHPYTRYTLEPRYPINHALRRQRPGLDLRDKAKEAKRREDRMEVKTLINNFLHYKKMTIPNKK